ncbi:unnamed protein product [Camellia sinensis]
MRKNSEPFTGSLTRNLSIGENFLNAITADLNSNNKCSSSLSMVVRAILLDKKPEKVPILMESVLSKVMEEFEHHIASQTELVEEKRFMRVKREECFSEVNSSHYKSWYVAHANEVSRGHPQCWWRAEVNSSHYKSWYVVHANEVSRGHPQCWWSLHIHGLACVASGYHKVLEENHKLYNQVQDLKGRKQIMWWVQQPSMTVVVALIGSEWVNKSEVTGDRLKEAQHINKSLSALGDVIFSLAQKNSHVPYRSRGKAKTLMFVHISPELDVVGETISTLKFAERVAIVELGAACVNKNSADVEELKEQP